MRGGGLIGDVEGFDVGEDLVTVHLVALCCGHVGLGEGIWIRD